MARCLTFVLMSLTFVATANAAVSGGSLWQLSLDDLHPHGCSINYMHQTRDEKGQPCFSADSRGSNGSWNSCIQIPKGLMQAGQEYVVTVNYEITDRPDQNSYFYVFARSGSLGNGADKWQRWRGEPGERGVAKLHIAPTSDDYGVCVGIHDRGAMRISGMKIIQGNDLQTLALDQNSGYGNRAVNPSGAVGFTVEPPSNSGGSIVNLADFGAVVDGEPKAVPGTDTNFLALKSAIAKCRETHAARLTVPKGIYRISSEETILFEDLRDFVFDGGGATFLFDQTKGGAAIQIKNCSHSVFSNFNVDWDWEKDPLASVGKIVKVAPDRSFFEMRFETPATLDPKRWVTINQLDEKLRAPGAGHEFGAFGPKKIEPLDRFTVRVWPTYSMAVHPGELYLLRHHIFARHCILMGGNTHLSLRGVTVYSFPGIGFIVGGDQHHFELLHCRVTYPETGQRSITTTSDCFHVDQSQGFMKLVDCDFGYSGDDCVNIHDNIHTGVKQTDAHTLIATGFLPWSCPYSPGDLIEIRNHDYSPTGFKGKLKAVNPDYKTRQSELIFEDELPDKVAADVILWNHRYGSHNFIVRNCFFHENRARGMLCNTADGLVEGNRFFHNQAAAVLCLTDVGPSWSEGFGARNIVFRDNTFEAENSCGSFDGAAVSIYASSNGIFSKYPILTNILFENNTFKEMTGPAIEAKSFKDVSIVRNTFINAHKPPIDLKMRGSIFAELGSGLTVEQNTWSTHKGMVRPELFYDGDTTRGIECSGNTVKQ